MKTGNKKIHRSILEPEGTGQLWNVICQLQIYKDSRNLVSDIYVPKEGYYSERERETERQRQTERDRAEMKMAAKEGRGTKQQCQWRDVDQRKEGVIDCYEKGMQSENYLQPEKKLERSKFCQTERVQKKMVI